MPIVTALRPARRSAAQFDVEIDGAVVGPVSEAEVVRYGLAPGVIVDEETLVALQAASGLAQALALINGYLAHRPRSEAEVRQRLRRAAFDPQTIDVAMQALIAQGLLDDRRFASLWVESRASFSPRSQRLLALELQRKGVERERIEEVLADTGADDGVLAIDAGRKRLRAFATLDEETFQRRMGGYLARRGFAHDQVRVALTRLWAELHAPLDGSGQDAE